MTIPVKGQYFSLRETYVCDTAAILRDQQEAVGAADRELGAGDWARLLSVGLSLCL